MDRRRFCQTMAASAAAGVIRPSTVLSQDDAGKIMTVSGPIAPESLGVTLPHEHVLVDFIGADRVSRDRYDADEAFTVILPYLKAVRELGCQSMVECTPAYIGRDPILLKRLSAASGMNLLTNTGYYGAAGDKYLPPHAFSETVDQLAARWINEWKEGIEGTDIRPGFIKTGVDYGSLSEIDRKLIRAAARTHLATGLVIAAHTGGGGAFKDELAVLAEEGVAGEAFIWVHAQNESDPNLHAQAAEQGAWVSFDGVSSQSVSSYVAKLREMKRRNLLHKTMLSHDAGWYNVGEPKGGQFRSYDVLFTELIPALKKADFADEDIRQIAVENPRQAFTIAVKAVKNSIR
ncbi:MAG: phosphotriesterase [Candidatus Omnitrophota bacterium]